ncbi:hypothetical protein F6455_07965 [Proteobacteria bacterium 005FR1]|nr:hypothetical protein [Proteobacteria bacterium 005FR1]
MSLSEADHRRASARIDRSMLAMTGALVLTSLLALFGVWRIVELTEATISRHAYDLVQLQELRLLVETTISLDRAFLLTGDPAIATESQQANQSFDQHATDLGAHLSTAKGTSLLSAVVSKKQAHSRAVQNMINSRLEGTDFEEVVEEFREQVRPRTQAVREALSSLLVYKADRMEEAARATATAANIAQLSLLGLAIVNLGICVVIWFFAGRTRSTLDNYASQLLQAVRDREEFLAVASHELRTPLSVLKLRTQMLLRRLDGSDEVAGSPESIRSFAQQVEHGVDTLSQLVSRMLDLANVSRGQLTLNRETTELNTLVATIVERTAPVFAEAHCPIDFRSGVAAMGEWDQARLEQVISNLLMNVVRHAPGTRASVSVDADDRCARLIVDDEGPGIPEGDRTRIFERFERAHVAADGSGLGLGLAVSREIVGAHGGRLWAEENEARGARFIMELPLKRGSQECQGVS